MAINNEDIVEVRTLDAAVEIASLTHFGIVAQFVLGNKFAVFFPKPYVLQ